jgi:uncharacterized protein
MQQQFNDNNVKNAIPDQIFSPLYGVQLKDGLFADVFARNCDFLKTIDMDAMLYWFRKRAGKEAPGEPYRGHFEDNIKGQTAGMVLMGAGNALRWHEDPDLRQIMNQIVDEIKDCQEPDGYLMAVPQTEFGTKEYPHYVRIWLTYGLHAAALAGRQDAWGMLRHWQDWFNQCDDLPIIKFLTLAFQGVVASTYLFNTPIGRQADIDKTIEHYEEDWRLGQFIMKERNAIHIRKQPGHEPHPHGTEIEAMEGYLDLYRNTGKHYYLRAVRNFYDLYKQDWMTVGGGIAMCEFLVAEPRCYPLAPPKPYNELCCSSFWILLNQRFHRLFPEQESYVSEMEASLYNIAIANQDGGEGIRYFAWIDQHKQPGGKVHCCCGVGTRLFGLLPEFIYSAGADALYVDLYAASSFQWDRADGPVTIDMATGFPYDGQVAIDITCEKPQDFELKLRIPGWAAGDVAININGESIIGQTGSYVTIRRFWQGKTTISYTLPFGWRLSKYIGKEAIRGTADASDKAAATLARYALEYGPLLMAFAGPLNSDQHLVLPHDPRKYAEWLVPAAEPLTFQIQDMPEVSLVPYFSLELSQLSHPAERVGFSGAAV